MADRTTELAIVIEAINKASAILKDVEKDLGKLAGAVEEQGATAQTAALGFGELVTGVALGGTMAIIAASAFQKLTSTLVNLPVMLLDIAKGASEVEGLAVAMHVVANNAGVSAEAIDEVRDSVVDQNITTEAANRLLTDLIRNQLDYTQATELAAAAQNIAVASGVSSSETIERISTSIASGNTWLLRQLGLVEHLDKVYERYAGTLDKTSEELTESQRKQAVVNYVLQEGEKYAGAYDQAMKNAAKVMRSTTDRVKEISYSLGRVFEPALYEVTKTIYDFVDSIVKWAHENEDKLRAIAKSIGDFMHRAVASIKSFIAGIPWDKVIEDFNRIIRRVIQFGSSLRVVFNAVQIFVKGILATVEAVKTLGRALWALMRRDFDELRRIYYDFAEYSHKTMDSIGGDIEAIGKAWKSSLEAQNFDLKEWWKNIKEIDGAGWEDRLKEQEEGLEKLTAKQQKALKKILEDFEKENKKYQRAVEKRVKQFEESFDDLVIAHRDAIEDLTKDLEEEVKDYRKKLADLVEDFDEAMEDIEDRHEKKTESIMENMEDERKKAEEEIEELVEKYNEETSLIEREGEARLSNLKVQLDKEKALGDDADKDKIDALKQMIAFEEKGLADALDDKKDKHGEEVADIEEKLQDKLDKIQKELDEENEMYTDAFADRKKQYDKDVADAKEAYEEKRKSLQEELDKETAIREKYADYFARLADAIAESDLDRLVRKHGEELAEMARDHEEKLAEIEKKAFEQGETFAREFAAGIGAGYPQIKSEINKIENDIDRITAKAEAFTFGGGATRGYGATGDWGFEIPEFPGRFRAQRGGLFSRPTIVGEAGAEIVLPLNFPKRMAMIMKSLGMGGERQGQVVQNFYITVDNKQDIDVLMERAGFAMKQGGGYI